MYRVLYRKWRPKVFDDVVGQDHVVDTLKNEVTCGHVSHAYLFTGSRGTGKTSCAKIFSKAVNCPNSQDGNPCLECSFCKGIDSGSIMDVEEIDAASNNGVENVRSIREEASFMPSVCKYRIYIIDEVHMLSTGAFNALLKILEEPPQHVIFILATTDVHKVPLTIISRCQQFNFYKIPPRLISDRLKYICEKENITVDPEALNLISRISDGALRDALSILDQFSNQGEEKITLEKLEKTMGFISKEYVIKLLKLVKNNNPSEILMFIEDLNKKCVNFSKACESIADYFRNLLWYKIVKDPQKSDFEIDLSIKFEDNSVDQIIGCVEILKSAYKNMSTGGRPRYEFEICILKILEVLNQKRHEEGKIKKVAEVKELKDSKIESFSPKLTENKVAIKTKKLAEFPHWDEILELLEKDLKSKSMVKAFKDSQAFESGNFLLIKPTNSLVFEFLRDVSHRDSLRSLVKKVTGKHYNLGPYKEEEYTEIPNKKDLISSFCSDAVRSGIDVKIDDN